MKERKELKEKDTKIIKKERHCFIRHSYTYC